MGCGQDCKYGREADVTPFEQGNGRGACSTRLKTKGDGCGAMQFR
jgi:hypothetical protein